MSSESIIALVAVITSGVLGVASLGFNFWNSSSERRQRLKDRREDNREWYRRTLFEKRLQAVQQASRWLAQIKEAIWPDPDLVGDPGPRLLNTVEDAREWYAKNFVYVHGGMPNECPFAAFLLAAYWHARGYADIPDDSLLQGASDLVKQKALEVLEALWESKKRGG